VSPPGVAKTLIFLSADIVEATKFKDSVRGPDENPAWFDAFEAFFRELPLVFMGQAAGAFAEVEELPNIRVWKVFGDEIVFRVQSRSADDALRLTEAFHHALDSYGSRFLERWPLRFRGCIWAARFPGRNIEFEIPEMAAGNEATDSAYADYLGPDVDLGFRLSHHAGPGQLIVSLNLAETLAALAAHRGIRFHHVGQAILKGVFHGRPYPLIMITLPDCVPESLGGDPPMAPDALIDLAKRTRSDLNATYDLKLRPLEF
jgi:class 3 adenylate cyclase